MFNFPQIKEISSLRIKKKQLEHKFLALLHIVYEHAILN